MTLTLDDLTFLTSPAGAELLARLKDEDLAEANSLTLLTRLRKAYPADHARAALELARLRLKAVDKFGPSAAKLYFTREALEQASDRLIRQWRAGQLAQVVETIVDAGCGIGSDSLAFAGAGLTVTGLDRDPLRVAMAQHNAAALGLAATFHVGDVTVDLPQAEAVFFDPARRDEAGNRLYQVEQYQPPLSTIHGWSHRLQVVKLAPGVEIEQLEAYGGQIAFISVNGDLKEANLWRGLDATGLKAVLLTGEAALTWPNDGSYQPLDLEIPVTPPHGWLIEPDPALLRAGLVQDAAQQFNGTLLDETIAYFTSDTQPQSPWVRAWRILDWMPFNLKKLRTYLREHNVGNVTVKKRGTAVTPDTLIPQLKLSGANSRTLVLTRCRGQQIVMVCEDIAP